MSEIVGFGANLLKVYYSCQERGVMSMEEMFKSLSLSLGGDGEKITKKDLDKYIENADKGLVDVGKTKLRALKMIQKNWGTISQDKDYITLSDMKDYSFLLIMAVYGDTSASDPSNELTTEDEQKDTAIIEDLMKNTKDCTPSEVCDKLANLLKDLLNGTDDTSDEENANLIAAVTNLIADSSQTYTVEAQA